jgi:hypothetical protein
MVDYDLEIAEQFVSIGDSYSGSEAQISSTRAFPVSVRVPVPRFGLS